MTKQQLIDKINEHSTAIYSKYKLSRMSKGALLELLYKILQIYSVVNYARTIRESFPTLTEQEIRNVIAPTNADRMKMLKQLQHELHEIENKYKL